MDGPAVAKLLDSVAEKLNKSAIEARERLREERHSFGHNLIGAMASKNGKRVVHFYVAIAMSEHEDRIMAFSDVVDEYYSRTGFKARTTKFSPG